MFIINKWTDNGFDDEGATIIGTSLVTNTTLTELDLAGNCKIYGETNAENRWGKWNKQGIRLEMKGQQKFAKH